MTWSDNADEKRDESVEQPTESKDSTVLRPLAMTDVDNLMTWVNDPAVIGKFATFHDHRTRDEEEAYVRNMLGSKTDIVYSIECGGEYAGQAGLHEIERRNNKGRLALVLKKDFQKHGYGEKVLKKFLRELFDNYGMHKVWAVVDVTNQRMQHVCEKAGFQYEGVAREEYLRDGEYRDMMRMSILEKEFYKMHGEKSGGNNA